jgi:hypothetical protein
MDAQLEKMLDDWTAIRNAMVRADAGELIVKYMRASDFIMMEGEGGEGAAAVQALKDAGKDKIVGIYVDMILKFPEALDRELTEEEINNVKSAIAALESAQKEEK